MAIQSGFHVTTSHALITWSSVTRNCCALSRLGPLELAKHAPMGRGHGTTLKSAKTTESVLVEGGIISGWAHSGLQGWRSAMEDAVVAAGGVFLDSTSK